MKQKRKLFYVTAIGFAILASLITPAVVRGQVFVPNPTLIGVGAAALADKAATVAKAISHPGATFVNYIANAISYLLAQLAAVIFNFAGMFVNVTLDLNAQVTQTPLARTGWAIVRDIANMGFVLVIVIIAIMTILKFEQYGVKKLLPKLIAAAIIINFSFAIAGVIIDFSNVLTNFFYSRVAANNFGIAENLAGAFNPQTLSAPPAQDNFNLDQQSQTFLETLGTNVLKLIFIVVFTLAGALTLFALAFMLLVRYLHLIFLLVIAPIIWLFWVFPGLGGEFNRWWKSFFKWSFFAPASAFFLYLALVSVADLNKIIGSTTKNSGYGSSDLMHLLGQGAQMFVLVGIMLGGIIIAQEMGITGAGAAMGIAKKAGSGASAWAKQRSLRYGTAPLRTDLGRRVTGGMQKFGQNLPLPLRALTSPIRDIGTGLAKTRLSAEKQVDDAKKNLPKGLDEQARQFENMSAPGQAAVLDNIGKEVKKTSDKKTGAQESQAKASRKISDLEALKAKGVLTDKEEKELKSATNDLEDARKEEEEANKRLMEMGLVLKELPNHARRALSRAGFEAKRTRLGKRFGVGQYITSQESNAQKIEEMMKKMAKEEGGEKKANAAEETTQKEPEEKQPRP